MSGCQGPCEQGKKQCQMPWACEVDESPHSPWTEIKADVILGAVLSGVVIVIAVLIAGLV